MICPKCGRKLRYEESPFTNELGEPEKTGYICQKCGYFIERFNKGE